MIHENHIICSKSLMERYKELLPEKTEINFGGFKIDIIESSLFPMDIGRDEPISGIMVQDGKIVKLLV